MLAFVLLPLFASASAQAVTFYVSRLAVAVSDPTAKIRTADRDFEKAFLADVRSRDTAQYLSFRELAPAAGSVHSVTDAERVASMYAYRYILYGSVSVGTTYVVTEIALYDASDHAVRERLFSKVELSNDAGAEADLARRFVDYAYRLFGLSSKAAQFRREFGGILLSTGVGSWLPMSSWANVLSGIVSGSAGIRIVPVVPLKRGTLGLTYFRFGANLFYQLALNAPGLVSATTHSFELFVPAELCMQPNSHNVLTIGIGPMLDVMLTHARPPYTSPSTTVNSTGGFALLASYEYWFRSSRQFGIGARAMTSFVFFRPELEYGSLELYGTMRFPAAGGNKHAGT